MDLPAEAWIVLLVVVAAATVGVLRVIGFEYSNAVRWHNIRVEVHRLRIEQQRRIEAMARGEPAARVPRGGDGDDVDILDDDDVLSRAA